MKADVYDNTTAILNRNRITGSRGKGKDNARDGKGARWKGQREENLTEYIENPGGSDNYQSQGEFGNGSGVITMATGGSGR